MMGDARTVVLLRHGRTPENAAGRYVSRSDPPLDAVGREQATRAGAALAGLHIDRIVASPSQRATQTAALVVEVLHSTLEVRVDDRVRELDVGPFEGSTPEQLATGPSADAFRAWRSDTDHRTPPGVEPVEAVASRAAALVADERRSPLLLVITHSLTARVLIADVIGLPLPHFRRLTLEEGRFVVLRWDERGGRLWQANVEEPRIPGTPPDAS